MKFGARLFSFQNEDARMQEIMKLAHRFLQSFCRGNESNQSLLHREIELFLTPGVSPRVVLA